MMKLVVFALLCCLCATPLYAGLSKKKTTAIVLTPVSIEDKADKTDKSEDDEE